ncbi:MAG: 2-dehydropantoate 2-reductase [Mailhella sp.]|nr:2-dehydropantoate 2-reductase [Mailhella sp.]
MKTFEHIAIIGMGALGILYGKHFAEALGRDAVEFVMDEERRGRNLGKAFRCNGESVSFRIVTPAEARQADLVMVAVKGPGLAQALDIMAPCIGPETAVVSVMNGISSEELIAERFGASRVLHCVAQGMDVMKLGDEVTFSRIGELRVGIAGEGLRVNLDALEALLDRAGIAWTEETDIRRRIWTKYMLNVGFNQTCMVYGTGYGGVLAEGEPNRMLIAAMREVIAVARAEGIMLTEEDLVRNVEMESTLDPASTPSMGQDRINRKKSEADLFGGTLIRLAARHGILVPANRYLYRRALEIEAAY